MGTAIETQRGALDAHSIVKGRRILVLGSRGRLGAALVREWGGAAQGVEGLDRSALDFADLDAIRERVGERQFDVAVNCAALTDVDRCEREPGLAQRVNGEAVGVLAAVCASKRAALVHISTDYVFDGHKREPYREEDPPHPISEYGRSKLVGEQAVLSASPRNSVVRVSWVFGPDRPSFVDGILKRAREGEELSAVSDKQAVPTYTVDAARALEAWIKVGGEGVVHLCNRGGCSWWEYGKFALECAQAAGMTLKQREVRPIQMSDLRAFVAKRPVYSVMDPTRFEQCAGVRLRNWQEAVEEYIRRSQ